MFFFSLVFFILLLASYQGFIRYLSVFMTIFCLYISLTSKKPFLTICSFFITSYFAYLIPYFFLNVAYATRQDFQTYDLSVITLRLNSVFTFIFLTIWSFGKNQHLNFSLKLPRKDNLIIFVFCLIVVLVLASLMISSSGNVFTSNYRDITEERYAFIDYSLIFVLMSFIFSSCKRNAYILAVVAIYCIICLLYGYRLRFLQMVLLTFILFYENRFDSKVIFKICIIGFTSLLVVGVFRGVDKSLSLASLLGGKENVIVSNQGGVFLNATMYIGLVENNLIDTSTRLTTFFGNFIGIFYSLAGLPESFNLVTYLSNRYSAPGGGLIVGYLYVWGGSVSIYVCSLLIGTFYRIAYSREKIHPIFAIYLVVIFFMFPRWYAYNPLHLIKMPFLAIVIFLIFSSIHYILIKANNVK